MTEIPTRSGLAPACPGSGPWGERAAEVAERRAKVFELRKLKVPYRDIALRLGISVGLARADYQQAMLDLLPVEEVEEQRRAELDLLEHLVHLQLRRLEPAFHVAVGNIPRDPELASIALGVDIDAGLRTLLKYLERYDRLAGLDRPVEQQVSVNVQVTDARSVASLRDELAERRERRTG